MRSTKTNPRRGNVGTTAAVLTGMIAFAVTGYFDTWLMETFLPKLVDHDGFVHVAVFVLLGQLAIPFTASLTFGYITWFLIMGELPQEAPSTQPLDLNKEVDRMLDESYLNTMSSVTGIPRKS